MARYREIILSLHPVWWEKMKAGLKPLEIRKSRPKGNGPYTVMVYITGGVGIVGEFTCDCFYELNTSPLSIWALPPDGSGTPYNLEKASCLSLQQPEEYAGSSNASMWGWHVTDVVEYERILSLSDIGIKRAPQSWCYAK